MVTNLELFGGPYAGTWPPDDRNSQEDYLAFWQEGDNVGDGALYDVVGDVGLFAGFHRELWPEHPQRFEKK